MKISDGTLDIDPLVRLIDSLDEVVDVESEDSILKDSMIKRFEYTIEMLWKTVARVIGELPCFQVEAHKVIEVLKKL